MDLAFITILGLVMGFVTSISGGSGVFGVPAMLAFGFSPIDTLALNRISDIGHVLGCAKNYFRAEKFSWKVAGAIAVLLTIGSAVGASFSVSAPEETLQWFILGAVFVGAGFLLYPVKPKPEDTPPHYILGGLALLAVGWWSGAVAMASSTFGVLAIVWFFHRSYLNAKSIHVFASVPDVLVASAILFFNSNVSWTLALAMIISSMVGAYAGSKMAIKRGSKFIRYAMVAMALVMVGKIVLVDIFKLV